jgi:phosphotransferase system HPr (HPr) family protein
MSRSSDVATEAVRTVVLPVDLHARPAGRFSQEAARHAAQVTVAAGEKEVDARSVLLVMALGATAGTEVTIRATGDDADQAANSLAELLADIAE